MGLDCWIFHDHVTKRRFHFSECFKRKQLEASTKQNVVLIVVSTNFHCGYAFNFRLDFFTLRSFCQAPTSFGGWTFCNSLLFCIINTLNSYRAFLHYYGT